MVTSVFRLNLVDFNGKIEFLHLVLRCSFPLFLIPIWALFLQVHPFSLGFHFRHRSCISLLIFSPPRHRTSWFIYRLGITGLDFPASPCRPRRLWFLSWDRILVCCSARGSCSLLEFIFLRGVRLLVFIYHLVAGPRFHFCVDTAASLCWWRNLAWGFLFPWSECWPVFTLKLLCSLFLSGARPSVLALPARSGFSAALFVKLWSFRFVEGSCRLKPVLFLSRRI
jgi:hypothetical protein